MPGCLKTLKLYLILTILFVSAAAAQAHGSEEKHFLIVLPSTENFWAPDIVFWARERASFWRNVDASLNFTVLAGKSEPEIAKAIMDKPDAVIALAASGAPYSPAIQKYYEAGGFTVLIGTAFSPSRQDVYVTGDQQSFGRLSAEFVAQEIGYQGRVAIMEGLNGQVNTRRVKAFKDVMARYPGISIIASEPSYWNAAKGRDLMKDYLRRFKHIDAVWCQSDLVAEEVLAVYRESRRNDLKLVLGGDGRQYTIKRILDGDALLRGDISHTQAVIKNGIDVAVRAKKGGEFFPLSILAPPELITKDNAREYYFGFGHW